MQTLYYTDVVKHGAELINISTFTFALQMDSSVCVPSLDGIVQRFSIFLVGSFFFITNTLDLLNQV